MQNIVRVFKMLPGWKIMLISIAIVGIAQSILNVAIPLIVQNVIDRLISGIGNKETVFNAVLVPLIILVSVRILLSVVVWIGEIISDTAFTHSVVTFRRKIADKLDNLPIHFFETRRAGQLASESNQSPHVLARWLQDVTENYLTTILQAIFAIIILAYKFLPIAFVVSGIALVYWIYIYQTIKTNQKFWKFNRGVINEWSGIQTENISFINEIRALGVRAQRSKIYNDALDRHEENLRKMWRYQHRRNFIATLIEILMYAIPIGVFAHRALQGLQNPTDIYVLAVYLASISTAVQRLNRMISETKNLEDTLGETLEIIDQSTDCVVPAVTANLTRINNIAFEDVVFKYKNVENSALNNVSFQIKEGQTTALVGRSGSGKSTIIKLILRFYDATGGTIKINDKNVFDYNPDSIRARTGVVMQDTALFNGTVIDNLKIAKPGATKAMIEQACKLAYAHDFITNLPDGYKTTVGERGVKLSGGEKQRISIARAILRNPDLILLDEATSALDSESEKAVQNGLKYLLQDRTALIIAHRLSTIKHADKILVIDKGRVVESGTYKQLREANGLFAELLAHQEI
jgi:ABC-type multidrug transport system fused ATPase/permease subunit